MRILAALAVPLALAACAGPGTVAVGDAWVRLAAVPGRPAAGYFTLTGGSADATLLRVTSPATARIELHASMQMAGETARMTMRPIAAVPVGAGATVRFAPGGKHLMLFDVAPGIAPGGKLRLDFAFADGRTLTQAARVLAAGDAAPGS